MDEPTSKPAKKRSVKKIIFLSILLILLLGIIALMISFLISHARYESFVKEIAQRHQKPVSFVHGKPLPPTDDNSKKPIRILSLIGGGTHGIMQLQVLNYIEKQTHKPISQLFDVVGCISTGCLNTALLLKPDYQHPTKPAYSAQYLIDHYPELAKQVFRVFWYRKLETVWGLTGPLFSSTVKYMTLQGYFGNAPVRTFLKPAYLCATQFRSLKWICYKSWKAPDNQLLINQVVNAASNPPAFFHPGVISTRYSHYKKAVDDTHHIKHLHIDGALVSNDTALMLLLQMMIKYPHRPIILVDVGTGNDTFSLSQDAVSWGPLHWMLNIVQILFYTRHDNLQDVIQYIAKLPGSDIHFYNIDIDMKKYIPPLAYAPSQITELNKSGLEMVQKNKKKLDEAIKHLEEG